MKVRYCHRLGVIAAASLFLVLSACTTVQHCTQLTQAGNCGSFVNSTADDYGPRNYGGSLIITSHRKVAESGMAGVPSPGGDVVLQCLRMDDGGFAPARTCMDIPPFAWGGGTPAVWRDGDSVVHAVFTMTQGRAQKTQTDLYTSVARGGTWSAPVLLESCSSPYWESQPFVSDDGTMLLFTSDRPGGKGGIDIYVSSREVGGWGAPRNLGSVNTAADETTPSFDTDDNILFASNRRVGRSTSSDFNLYRAHADGQTLWSEVDLLPRPLNSEYDEISPLVWGDSLFFASNRKGGCGGYDVYGMVQCGPVLLRGEIRASRSVAKRSGYINLIDSSGTVQQTLVREDGRFDIRILPKRSYTLRYVNDCEKDAIEQRFNSPCDETATVVIESAVQLPDTPLRISLDETSPLFTPGLYRPLTSAVLNNLRLQSELNLLPTDAVPLRFKALPSTADELARAVDSTITRFCSEVLREVDRRARGCRASSTLTINITGYADRTPMSSAERYEEQSLIDATNDLRVLRGSALDDSSLAALRALFMKKTLEEKLRSMSQQTLAPDAIRWVLRSAETQRSQQSSAPSRTVDVAVQEEDLP